MSIVCTDDTVSHAYASPFPLLFISANACWSPATWSSRTSSLARSIRRNLGRPYSHDYWRPVHNRFFPYLPLATPTYRRPRFCTDLVAETLESVGVLDFGPTDKTPADMIPSDFTEQQQALPLTGGYSYDSEIMIAY